MSQKGSTRKSTATGLRHLETLRPHDDSQDWRRKQPYGRWRFAWRAPLFGGRLPSPAWFGQRVEELYRFTVPPGLLVLGGVLAWRLTQGQEVNAWLWLLLLPLIFEIPKALRFVGTVCFLVWNSWRIVTELFGLIAYVITMLLVLARIK